MVAVATLVTSSNMASQRRSLSDFHGQSWSSWSDYAGRHALPDEEEGEDEGETWRKSTDVMRLFCADMGTFGLFPETDSFCTVVCEKCGAVKKPQGLLKHTRMRHKELLNSLNSIKSMTPSISVTSCVSPATGPSALVGYNSSGGSAITPAFITPVSVTNSSTVVPTICGVMSPAFAQGTVTSTSRAGTPPVTPTVTPTVTPDKLQSPSIRSSAKHMLNEKLLSKLVLSEKLGNKSSSNDKLSGLPSDKHKSSSEKSKHINSDKIFSKSSEKLVSKSSKSNEKTKSSGGEKNNSSGPSDKNLSRTDGDRQFKSQHDIYAKQNDMTAKSSAEKSSKSSDKQSLKLPTNDKHLSKVSLLEGKLPSEKTSQDKSKSSEKSVKSVLSEKLLSKAAANEKNTLLSEKLKPPEVLKTDVLTKNDRIMAKPAMKSLLKEKISKPENVTQGLVPGSSLLRPVVRLEKELLPPGVIPGTLTTLSPPILTPQNRTPEHQHSTMDMPVLSRKRKYRERKTTPTQFDPDRHCGVHCDFFNKFCVRSLTCKVHSVSLRRAVPGRSKPFDLLLLEHRRAKEDQRSSREDQDETSETSPLPSECAPSPSEPSCSPNASSPYASPSSSPRASSAHIVVQGCTAVTEEPATALTTPSVFTSPPIPLPSYQYPPFPPPMSTSPSLPDNAPSLSHLLSTPLLDLALPSLSPSHAPRPPDFSKSNGVDGPGHAKSARATIRENNKLHISKTRQFNVKHAAFPPKPLRACLFQGRKSSGMFLTQRQLEVMRAGFNMAVVKGNKSLPLQHMSMPNNSSGLMSVDATASNNSFVHTVTDSLMVGQAVNSTSQVNTSPALKSILSTVSGAKAVINSGDLQQRISRTQKVTTIPATSTQRVNLNSMQPTSMSSVRLPVSSTAVNSAPGVLRVPVSLKAVLPKPAPSSAPVRYTLAARENGQFHVPNILTASRVRTEEPKLVARTGSSGQSRLNTDHVFSTLVPHISTPVAVTITNGPDPVSSQATASESTATLASEKLTQGVRIAVPTTVPQQITYLTATTPVTFQQVPIINPQVLSQLQLHSKGSGGTLKLLSASGGARTLLVHQDQEGAGTDS